MYLKLKISIIHFGGEFALIIHDSSDNVNEKLIQDRKIDFIEDLEKRSFITVKNLYSYIRNNSQEAVEDIERFFHSIKGSGSMLGLDEVSDIGSNYESKIQTLLPDNEENFEKIIITVLEGLTALDDVITKNVPKDEKHDMYSELKAFAEKMYKGSILIIDDDLRLIDLVEKVLQREGYYVFLASNNEEAVEIVKKNKIELVLLDINIPNINGFEILKNLRAHYYKNKIILMTAKSLSEIASGLQSNKTDEVDDYLIKPFTVKKLIAKVALHFKETSPNYKNTNTPEAEQSSGEKTGNSNPRVLLVDDENIIIKLIKTRLDTAGYSVNFSNDGEDALKKLGESVPDILVLDLNLPKISGFDVLFEVRKNFKSDVLKILVLSSKSREEDKIRCFNLGADDYLTKPFSVGELEFKINKLILDLKR